MQIEVVARTIVDIDTVGQYMEFDYSSTGAEDLAEFAGRACYQSFNKPNAATRYNEDYLANILAQGHESVLEHASISFYVQGVSRNMLLELERHRHLSFSVISTRFVNSEHTEVIIPPALRGDTISENVIIEQAEQARQAYVALNDRLVLAGKSRKEAREAARVALSGNLETKFVVTGNMRAWRDVLKKRYSTHADAEIRQFAERVLELLRMEAPNIFQDFPDQAFD